MVRPRRRIHKHAAIIAPAGGAMTDFAFDDLSDVSAVVNPCGPIRELLRMARLAIGGALELRFVGGDLGYRVSSIVSVFVKRIGGKKSFCSICHHTEDHHQDDESNDVSRHGFPASQRYLLNLVVWNC